MRARPAVPADAAEIVRLAKMMFDLFITTPNDGTWEQLGQQEVSDRLGDDLAVFVIDHPSEPGRLVASAAGTVAHRLPTPFNPAGLAGYVQWVCTDTEFRSQGLGREVMSGLLDWYDGRGVVAVELHATEMGEALYRSLGFDEAGPKALRRRRRVTS